MSAEQFSKLSLGDAMVTTRAGAAKAARDNSKSPQDPDHDQALPSIESPPVSPAPSLVISTTNLQYNVSAFNTDLRKRAKKGLEENEIRIKYCTVADNEHGPDGTKYFYIEDDITVAIGGKLRRPICTCGANDGGLACKHIYWVGDQILSTVSESLNDQPLELSADGSSIEDIKPADILEAKSLASVANDLKWVIREAGHPEDDDEMRDAIISMLSVFEPQDALPGEFKCPESPLASERSKRYQEFADLFTQYATRDTGLYLQVRNIIDPDFQSRVFFEKIDTRVTRTFNALDEYITHGTTNVSPETLRLDVPSCAKKLRALVQAIDEFYHQQIDDDRDTRDVAVRAAAALVTILDRVTDRNANAYEDITWGMEAPSDPVENNLFVALIGSYVGGEPPFVLSALLSLPQDDVHRNHWETLQNIEQKLADPSTPAEYMTAFRKVVYESRKRAASEVREGESKRAMQE
ncbi:Nn.00g099530.m01.CDS01 [Neocucurbitaria sp. VM-36]